MIRLIGRVLSNVFPTGTILPILRGPLTGLKWIVGAAAGNGKGLSSIFNLGEPEQFEFVQNLSSSLKNTVSFDIGANVGLYSLLFSKYSSHVYAFEPSPRNLMFLYRTITINDIKNVTIVPCAISSKLELTQFAEGDNCALGKLSDVGSQPVLTVSCDEFVNFYSIIPKLIKIDVEGAELEVLKGSEILLKTHHPIILLSTHSEALRKDCLDLLKSFGYAYFHPLNNSQLEKATEFAIVLDHFFLEHAR